MPKKLIEIDLPLDAINRQSAREKSIRHGHPSTLHMWWARRPLAACRAVIFASLVDDPSSLPDDFPTKDAQDAERKRLHNLIERLVAWEATDETRPESRELIDEARHEIARSVARSRGEKPPDATDPAAVLRYLDKAALPIYDPFAGGGSIPLEAQRLGLRAVASDLNPVAVLINKALIEIPPQFAGKPPVNPDAADPLGMKTGKMIGRGKNRKPEVIAPRGALGLADDIRHYGRWMRERAYERIGHLYPKAKLPNGEEATVIAWLWARTVPCPNPACRADMPLMKTFQLSKKPNNRHWTKPVATKNSDGSTTVSFEVQNHDGGVPSGGAVGRYGANCIACDASVLLSYVREQARAGEMRETMTAIVAGGDRKRLFVSPTDEHLKAASAAEPKWRPSGSLPKQTEALGFRVQNYGFTEWHSLFTQRQLTALTTFSDLIPEARELILEHGASAEYANSVCTYLALAIGKFSHGCSNYSRWQNSGDKVTGVFARQALSMLWDFAESNPFCSATQNWLAQIDWVANVLERLPSNVNSARTLQADASTTIHTDKGPIIVTDPPYYDNIGYADLSDYFYVWFRPLLRDMHPDLFSGMATPKSEEMVATPRFEKARDRFEYLLNKTLRLIRRRATSEFPSSIFYAYKQQEETRGGKTSTGWETMLTALVDAGFRIIGTWPMRTELANRPRGIGSNSLASSVILVCRPRPDDAPIRSRRQFIADLKREMPERLEQLESQVAPADRAQSAIGPGMEIYSRYSGVETLDGHPVTVGEALALINNSIEEYDDREEGGFDPATRFCIAWLKQSGWGEGEYGVAEVLAQAKNVAIDPLTHLLIVGGGKVRLHPPKSYRPGGAAGELVPTTTWDAYHQMAWHFGSDPDAQRHPGAAAIARNISAELYDSVRRLEQTIYAHYDRRGDARQALQFNALGAEWDRITIERNKPVDAGEQPRLIRR